MGSRRVGHDWATSLSLLHTGEGNGNPSRVPAWRIPGTGEPGGLPSMGRAGSATLQLPSSSSRARHTPLNYIPWGQYQAGFCCSVAKSSPTLRTRGPSVQALLPGSFCSWISQARIHGSGLPFPPQGDLPTQEKNPSLLHWQVQQGSSIW